VALPAVVKPSREGSSLGISIVRTRAELPGALAAAGRFGGEILIEAYIEGREITVGILGEEPLPVVEIRPKHGFFDYAAKYTAGLTDYLVPAPIPEDAARGAQVCALRAHQALGCRHLSRADFILRPDGTPVLLEVNTVPGFTPTSLLPKAAACAGISYDALCEALVEMARPAHV
jgi:D-alanine-D-alanine ligase